MQDLLVYIVFTDFVTRPVEFDDGFDGPSTAGPHRFYHRLPQAATANGGPELGHLHQG